MKRQFSNLVHQNELNEHYGAYLFASFCEYTQLTEGTSDISDKDAAKKVYDNLVRWFFVNGRNYLHNLGTLADAEYAVFSYTGITDPSDIQVLFKDSTRLTSLGYKIPFTVNVKKRHRRTKEEIEAARAAAADKTTDSEIRIIAPVQEKTEQTISDILDDATSEIEEYVPIIRKKRMKYSGVTRVWNQHLGIKIVEPVSESEIKTENAFVVHGIPGKNDVVLVYPCEKGKNVADYNLDKTSPASWKHPYLLAIRHDYVNRTGCKIIDVRKVRLDKWKSHYKSKYAAQKKYNIKNKIG